MSNENQLAAARPAKLAWAPHGYGFSLEFDNRYAVFTDGTIIRRACELRGRHGSVRKCREMPLSPFDCNNGYLCVTIAFREKYSRRPVHVLVCAAFRGEAPLCHEVNHKDGNKKNNSVSNLEWVTRRGNQLHAANAGLKPVGEKSHLHKLTEDGVQLVRALLCAGDMSQAQIGRLFGVSQTCVSKIATNKKWKQLKPVN